MTDGRKQCHAAVRLLQAVYQMAEDAGDRVAQGRSLWQLGSALSDQGHFKDAEVPLREALTVLEGELGGDHLDIAKACNGEALSLPEGHADPWSAAASPPCFGHARISIHPGQLSRGRLQILLTAPYLSECYVGRWVQFYNCA